jgi:uncharacterized protein YkwD
MRLKRWLRADTALTGLIFTAGFCLTASANTQGKFGSFSKDDGTYSVQTVTSLDACKALCKADSQTCRGTVIYQADVTKPEMECRLNNGFGENPAFPRIPPEELDFDKALAELNAYRQSKNLPALTYNERLNRASEVHAKDLAQAGIISHTGTDGSGHGDRVQRQGYYFSIAGENVATGQMSWDDVFDAWKKSPGHNENLLRNDVSEFGLALVYEPTTTYSTYWAMLVAHPLDINYSAKAQ